jgi:hypothetical protein
MLHLNGKWAAAVGLLAVLGLFLGCGRKANVTVKGTVVRGGQPLPVSKTGVLQVTLRPDLGEGEQYTPKVAECDRATGQFVIPDVPPGKYKVGVEQFDPNPQTEKLNHAFTADKGKFIRDIDGKEPLVIDLAKPQ